MAHKGIVTHPRLSLLNKKSKNHSIQVHHMYLLKHIYIFKQGHNV